MTHRRRFRGFLIDVEGVLVGDKRYQPIPGSIGWIDALVAAERPFCLVSNNTTHRPHEQIAALTAAGFTLTEEQLIGALGIGVGWLRARGRKRLNWLGVPRLDPYWREEGFTLAPEGPCDAVVLGVDPALRIARLEAALPQLQDHGADLVCLHRNLFYLDAEGRRRLGPGAWAAALVPLVAGGTVITIGKPEPPIYRAALERIGVPAREALFISDDPLSDLRGAKRLGMGTALVLSGKYRDHGVLGRMDQEEWPDAVCGRLADLTAEIEA
jgi:HAD superfamily hydrolase (TIGR01450 family)